MTHSEWLQEGAKRFGENYDDWRFVCPVCKHVASIGDFRQYKDRGATPDSAAMECIGRYRSNARAAINFFDEERARLDATRPPQPCDYAAFGLLHLTTATVEFEEGKFVRVFDFAPPATSS